eukprot:22345-Pelagococcus_subviridis.AAC.1
MPLPSLVHMNDPSHGAPFARAHCSIFKWPLFAASRQVCSFHGHPRSFAHLATSTFPPLVMHPADRPDEVRHPPELPPHRREVLHVADGRIEHDVAQTPAHQREHREVAAVEPREHVRVEDNARVRGESFQARARGDIWGSRSVPRDLVDVPAVHP